MNVQTSKSIKGSFASKGSFKNTITAQLKENCGLIGFKTTGGSNQRNDFQFKQSPKTLANKSSFDKNRECSSGKEELLSHLQACRNQTKSKSKLQIVNPQPTKNTTGLKNFLKSSSNQYRTTGPNKIDTQGLFSSPPAPQKTKTVLLSLPNSTGKPTSFLSKGYNGSNDKIGNTFLKAFEKKTNSGGSKTAQVSLLDKEISNEQSCINHPEKKVKYMIAEKTQGYSKEMMNAGYCSRCAVKMAEGGVRLIQVESLKSRTYIDDSNCEEISEAKLQQRYETSEFSFEDKENCQTQILNFLKILKSTQDSCDKFRTLLNRKILSLDNAYIRQEEQLDSHFEKIIQHFISKKDQLKKQLQTSFKKNKQQLIQKSKTVDMYTDGFNDIHVDVEQHVDKIIQNLNFDTLTSILNVYKDQIDAFNNFKDESEKVQFSQHQVKFQEDFEKLKQSFDPKIQVIIKNWLLVDKRKLKTTESSQFGDQNLKTSELLKDDNSMDKPMFQTSRLLDSVKSDLIISFDKTNSQTLNNLNEKSQKQIFQTEVFNESFDQKSYNGYTKILDKIHHSQNAQQEFYSQFMNQKILSKERDSHKNPSNKASLDFEENHIFEFNNIDDNFANKQTPELGQKAQYPGAINDYFMRLGNRNREGEEKRRVDIECNEIMEHKNSLF